MHDPRSEQGPSQSVAKPTAVVTVTPRNPLKKLNLKVTTPGTSSTPELASNSPKLTVVQKSAQVVVNLIEKMSDSKLMESYLGKVFWPVRDMIVDFSYEYLKIQPKYSFRVQTGLPMEHVGLDSDTINTFKALCGRYHNSDTNLGDFLSTLVRAIPKPKKTSQEERMGMWFHIKRSFTTNEWPNNQKTRDESKDPNDFISKLKKNIYDDFIVVLRAIIPPNTVIGHHLNPNISFTVGDIGNEMLIPLEKSFDDQFLSKSNQDKADFIVNNMLHLVMNDSTFVTPDETIKAKARQVIRFRYRVFELLKNEIKEFQALNDPDKMTAHPQILRQKLYKIGVEEGLVDPNKDEYPGSKSQPQQISFSGIRFSSSSYSPNGQLYYIWLAKDMKEFMMKDSSKKEIASILPNLDLEQPYEVTFITKLGEVNLNETRTQITSFSVNFKQGDKEIPATIRIKEKRGNHPDDTVITFACSAV